MMHFMIGLLRSGEILLYVRSLLLDHYNLQIRISFPKHLQYYHKILNEKSAVCSVHPFINILHILTLL